MIREQILQTFSIQIGLISIIVFFIFKSLLTKIILKFWKIITRKDFEIKEHPMYNVLKLFFTFLGFVIAMEVIPFNDKIMTIWREIFKIVMILFITRFITSLINKDSKILKKLMITSKNETVNTFICKIVNIIIWICSFFIIIKELGYDLTGLVAGLGIGSVIISLAAQDTVKSLLSGVVIFTDRPFEIGDWVEIAQFQGCIVDITFRSTRIKSYDNSIITIPNSVVTAEYIKNWNKLKSRRFDCILTVDKEVSVEKLKKIISQIKLVLKEHPKVKKDTVEVFLNDVASYSNDIKIFLYVSEINYIKFAKIKEELYCILLELLEKENIDLAFPTQTIQVKENTNEKINK